MLPDSRSLRLMTIAALLILALSSIPAPVVFAESCEAVVKMLNRRLSPRVDEQQLVGVLRGLNSTGNRRLPEEFVTKKEARSAGWHPGKDLWSVRGLQGKSIGGDTFRNNEQRLPDKRWREADLDFHGKKRGSKRLIFSPDGTRFVTVDHYRTFMEVPQCQ